MKKVYGKTYDCLIIDASDIIVPHVYTVGACEGSKAHTKNKRGLKTKLYFAVLVHALPLRAFCPKEKTLLL